MKAETVDRTKDRQSAPIVVGLTVKTPYSCFPHAASDIPAEIHTVAVLSGFGFSDCFDQLPELGYERLSRLARHRLQVVLPEAERRSSNLHEHASRPLAVNFLFGLSTSTVSSGESSRSPPLCTRIVTNMRSFSFLQSHEDFIVLGFMRTAQGMVSSASNQPLPWNIIRRRPSSRTGVHPRCCVIGRGQRTRAGSPPP